MLSLESANRHQIAVTSHLSWKSGSFPRDKTIVGEHGRGYSQGTRIGLRLDLANARSVSRWLDLI